MATVDPFGLPAKEAVQWFREKGYQLTWNWQDMWQEQHARAFTVAKVSQFDILADIRNAVDEALAQGKTLQEFTKELRPTLQSKGWWGEKTIDGQTVQLGSAHRLRNIYQTNLRMSQAAGRWERIERTAARRPYLRYVSVLDGRERDEHRRWHGTVLPWDHPRWKTHAPPNGWGCRCKLQQLSERDLERFGYSVSGDLADANKVRRWVNARTGQKLTVPKGISPGFAYNVGQAPRGFTPESPAPVLTPVRDFRDYSRVPANQVNGRPKAPQQWPERLSREAATERFRRELGIQPGHEAGTVADPTSMQVTFNQRYLDHLLEKEPERVRFVPYAVDTVRQPYEIWLVPHRLRDGTVIMRQRYISLYEDRGGGFQVVVDRDGDGNAVWTSYPRSNIDTKREGYLLWSRPE